MTDEEKEIIEEIEPQYTIIKLGSRGVKVIPKILGVTTPTELLVSIRDDRLQRGSLKVLNCSALVDYTNDIGIKFQRVHNIYDTGEGYLILVNDEPFPIEDLSIYPIIGEFSNYNYTVGNVPQ